MDSQLIKELTAQLYRQRSSLLGSTVVQNRQTTTAAERESEMEESAQNDRMMRLRSQLDERGHRMIRQIEAALERVATGTYGRCRTCEEEIAAARLKVLPTATLCIECARTIEKKSLSVREDKADWLPIALDNLEDRFYGKEKAA